MSANTEYIATIGIECHVQLATKTKLFAGVDNDARDADPNTLISPLCIGLPGTLPVLNAEAVSYAVRAGVALGCEIARYSKFDRKHYFYPDLPLGYQITQFDEPIILSGVLDVPVDENSRIQVRIHHAHLEADAGKSTHPAGKDYSLVDLNRAGTPLIEIVSEPDMHTPAEAKAYARELYLRMKYSGVSDVNLFYGNMRFDVNVSVSKTSELGTRTETKNINSFRAVEKAVEYEIQRQIAELEAGHVVVQETRGWDDAKQKTISQRSKENAHDYRYFPDPDIPPIVLTDADIERAAGTLPIMPNTLREQFRDLGLDYRQAEALIDEQELASELSRLIDGHDKKTAKTIANWYSGEIARLLSAEQITTAQVVQASAQLLTLVTMIDQNMLSSTSAKDMLEEIVVSGRDPELVAKDRNLLQVSDEGELEMIVMQVLSENQKAADDIKNGEVKAIGFIVGQVMKASGGKANPGVVTGIIKKLLNV